MLNCFRLDDERLKNNEAGDIITTYFSGEDCYADFNQIYNCYSCTDCGKVLSGNIMSQLRESGIIDIKRGPGGISITRDLDQITFLDIYKAVETNSEEDFFRFHENPNPDCPVGKNIRTSLDGALSVIQDKFEAELKTHTVADVYETTLKAIQEQAK